MTANDFYTLGYVCSGIVAICSIGFIVDRLTSTQKKVVGVVILVCLGLNVWLNYKGKEIESIASAASEILFKKRDSTNAANYETKLEKHYASTTNMLANYGLKVDTLNHIIQKMDTSIVKESLPSLTIPSTPYITTQGNERQLLYILRSLNADAHLIDIHYACINIKDSKLIGVPKSWLSQSTNQTDIVPKYLESLTTEDLAKSLFLDRGQALTVATDTFVLAIDVWYRSKKGKIMSPMRKIYRVVKTSNAVLPTSNSEFMEVAYYLKKYKIWPKFYEL